MCRRIAITLIVLSFLPILYVGSDGPLCWAFRQVWFDRVTFNRIEEFYTPLSRWMREGTPNDAYWR